MRQAVRAVIIHDDKLLIMHRNKFGHQYDTLPGGNIELGESPEGALQREIDEETSLVFKNPRLVFVEEAGAPYGTQYVYLCEYVDGTPVLRPDSEEAAINKLGQNLYEPKWVPLAELPGREFLSPQLKQAILHSHAHGFPSTPVRV